MTETYEEYWARREAEALQPLIDSAMVEVTAQWDAHKAKGQIVHGGSSAVLGMRLLLAQLRERDWLTIPDDEL